MAKLDFICKDCFWRVDNQSKLKCRKEVKQILVCNIKYIYRMISARSSGCLSKDGMNCKYFSPKNKNI